MATLRLAKVLKRKKLSKRRFSKLLGVHYNHVFRYFRPGYDPKLSQLNRWAEILGCKVKSLIDE